MTEITPAKGLHRLLYASRFSGRFPAEPADQDYEVNAIIRASIANNRAVGITGLLLVHQKHFLQALEGPAEAVMTTYNRILCDARHDAATLIMAGPAERRAFPDWNMCARRVSAADDAILDTLALKSTLDPTQLGPTAALSLLKVIRDIQARTAIVLA